MNIRVVRAHRDDALVLAGLQLQADIESGGTRRSGFLDEYADAWLAQYDRLPTWLALHPDGDPAGMVVTRFDRKLPSLCRPTTAVIHVASVFVRPQDRSHGIAEGMLREVLDWGRKEGVQRYTLNAEPKARTLYERLGFGAPNERWMERREG